MRARITSTPFVVVRGRAVYVIMRLECLQARGEKDANRHLDVLVST